jgi:hypothetical protein
MHTRIERLIRIKIWSLALGGHNSLFPHLIRALVGYNSLLPRFIFGTLVIHNPLCPDLIFAALLLVIHNALCPEFILPRFCLLDASPSVQTSSLPRFCLSITTPSCQTSSPDLLGKTPSVQTSSLDLLGLDTTPSVQTSSPCLLVTASLQTSSAPRASFREEGPEILISGCNLSKLATRDQAESYISTHQQQEGNKLLQQEGLQ